MKRLAAFLITFSLFVFGFSVSVADEEKQDEYTCGDFTYTLKEDGTAEIVKYLGSDKKSIVPDQLDGHRVSSIGEETFKYNGEVTSIVIPDSVKIINQNIFVTCDGLTELIVSPDHSDLAAIDGVFFSKADKRLVAYPIASEKTEYLIPQGIKAIGKFAFSGSKNLTSITIPDSVTSIEDHAFSGCRGLISIVIPDSVTIIRDATFYGCESLSSIMIPDSVISIGDIAFYACKGLTSIVIPDSVTYIGEEAFSICSSLSSIMIPNSVMSIGVGAFAYCKELLSIVIPDSVTSIGEYAFYECNNLTCIVGRDSYAKQYCEDNGIRYTYPDSLDWLND